MNLQTNMKSLDQFLFIIATETKRSFESPVIMLTMKDFAGSIFESLKQMPSALEQHALPAIIEDIIIAYHLEWLKAIQEVAAFKKRIRETPKEHMNNAIDFTINCVKSRLKLFHDYILRINPNINKQLRDSYENMVGIHANLIAVLTEKQESLYSMSDSKELYQRLLDETEELMNWLDLLYDNLALQYSYVIGCEFPKLSKTLQEIVKVVLSSSDPKAQDIAQQWKEKTKRLSSLCRLNYHEDLQIIALLDKIKKLEERIDRLRSENSSAVTALQHKTLYLEERILSLENLKKSFNTLIDKTHSTQNYLHMFDHLLLPAERCQLVEDLMKIWHEAIFNTKAEASKSIISILSVTDLKEIFSDEMGTFTVDKYGRKIYRGGDGNLYQLNGMNELVLLNDEDSRTYFYDDCGRYYLNETNERIYKNDDNASEYIMNDEGKLLRMKEYRDGREYWYDDLGCYILDDTGKRIYYDDTDKCYEDDGFGNLVLINTRNFESMTQFKCPDEPVVTQESKYLQQTVGLALRKCLAEVVLHQPSDPILYLADSLENFRVNMEIRQRRLEFEKEMMSERELRRREAEVYDATTAPASPYSSEGEEISYTDSNLITYQTENPE